MKKKELLEIFEKVPEDKKNEAKLILDELRFILTSLKKLKKQLRKDGPVEDFEQGSQKFKRESPALKGYNSLMKTYDTFFKSLLSLIPKESEYIVKSPEDDFDEFNK